LEKRSVGAFEGSEGAKEYDGRLLTMVLLLKTNVRCVRQQLVLNADIKRKFKMKIFKIIFTKISSKLLHEKSNP